MALLLGISAGEPPPRPTTPIQERVGGFIAKHHTKPLVKPLLKRDLMGCVQDGLSVEDFVRDIWQFGPNRLEWERNERDLQLNPVFAAAFQATMGHFEPERYPHFVMMVDDAVRKLIDTLGLEPPCPLVFEPLGDKKIKSERNERKPDVIAMPPLIADAWQESQANDAEGEKMSLKFSMVVVFMEFKPISGKKLATIQSPPKIVSEQQKVLTGTPAGLKRKAHSQGTLPSAKRRALDATDSTSTGTGSSSPVYRWGSPSTESTTSTSGSLAADRRYSRAAAVAVKADLEADVKEEGEVLVETAAASAAGTFIDETPTLRASKTPEAGPSRDIASKKLLVDVGDDGGKVTKAKKRKPPVLTSHELQAAGYASECLADGRRRYTTGFLIRDLMMSLWYYDRMGVVRSQEFNLIDNPRLFFLALAALTDCKMERFGYEPMIHPPPTMAPPTVGPPLHLDAWEIHIDHGIDADNILVPGVVKMKITGDPLYVQPGIVGRGTSVIPVTVIPGHEFAGLKAEKKLVVKFSWPAASRVDSEDGLLRRICKRIGAKEARHITPMRLSTTLEGARLGLPRMAESLRKLSGSVEERVLRVIVCDQLRPLKDLETLPDFQSVFLDLVRAHRVVFKRAHVIHRDLSISNVMFGETPERKPYGVLIDWDLAIDVEAKAGVGYAASASHRTGTGPFMAIDLLDSPEDSPHFYRHDLESFFYILIWCACGFLLGGEEVQERISIGSWAVEQWKGLGDKKSGLLYNPGKLKAAITTPFRPLWDTWIWPVANLISKAGIQAREDVESGLDCDSETLGGRMTYGKFMQTLGVDFDTAPYNVDLDLLD